VSLVVVMVVGMIGGVFVCHVSASRRKLIAGPNLIGRR
jgi:hypothetical protein